MTLLLHFVLAATACLTTSGATGDIQPISPGDFTDHPDLLKGLDAAKDKLNSQLADTGGLTYTLAETQASVQVVQGQIFRITAKATPEYCQGSNRGLPGCGAKTWSCSFKVWSRPWLSEQQSLLLQDWDCSPWASLFNSDSQRCIYPVYHSFRCSLLPVHNYGAHKIPLNTLTVSLFLSCTSELDVRWRVNYFICGIACLPVLGAQPGMGG